MGKWTMAKVVVDAYENWNDKSLNGADPDVYRVLLQGISANDGKRLAQLIVSLENSLQEKLIFVYTNGDVANTKLGSDARKSDLEKLYNEGRVEKYLLAILIARFDTTGSNEVISQVLKSKDRGEQYDMYASLPSRVGLLIGPGDKDGSDIIIAADKRYSVMIRNSLIESLNDVSTELQFV